MPLEIREIAIRMRVGEAEPTTSPALMRVGQEHGERVRDPIVEDCVRRVMAILKARQER